MPKIRRAWLSDEPLAVRPRSSGSSASNCTWSSMKKRELLAFCLTPGNVDDRHPVPKLVTGLTGSLFDDKGYLSQPLTQHLLVTQGRHLITKLRKRMRNRLLEMSDKLL